MGGLLSVNEERSRSPTHNCRKSQCFTKSCTSDFALDDSTVFELVRVRKSAGVFTLKGQLVHEFKSALYDSCYDCGLNDDIISIIDSMTDISECVDFGSIDTDEDYPSEIDMECFARCHLLTHKVRICAQWLVESEITEGVVKVAMLGAAHCGKTSLIASAALKKGFVMHDAMHLVDISWRKHICVGSLKHSGALDTRWVFFSPMDDCCQTATECERNFQNCDCFAVFIDAECKCPSAEVQLSAIQRVMKFSAVTECAKLPIVFVVAKCDAQSATTDWWLAAQRLCLRFDAPLIRTSAKRFANVDLVYHTLLKEMWYKVAADELRKRRRHRV